MCIAVPGILIEIANRRGKVDIKGNMVEADLGLVDAAVGDYVLVHAGCVLQTLQKNEAEEIQALLNELGDIYGL
jgi:hydrogenase expression/formation protein HypC